MYNNALIGTGHTHTITLEWHLEFDYENACNFQLKAGQRQNFMFHALLTATLKPVEPFHNPPFFPYIHACVSFLLLCMLVLLAEQHFHVLPKASEKSEWKCAHMLCHAMQAHILQVRIYTTNNNLYQSYTSTQTDRHTSGAVVLNNDRRVGRLFAVVAIVGVTLCCKELARRLGGGWGLAVSHVGWFGRAADVYPNGLLMLSIWGLIFVFLFYSVSVLIIIIDSSLYDFLFVLFFVVGTIFLIFKYRSVTLTLMMTMTMTTKTTTTIELCSFWMI